MTELKGLLYTYIYIYEVYPTPDETRHHKTIPCFAGFYILLLYVVDFISVSSMAR